MITIKLFENLVRVGSHVSMVVESKGTLAIDFDILYIRKIEKRT